MKDNNPYITLSKEECFSGVLKQLVVIRERMLPIFCLSGFRSGSVGYFGAHLSRDRYTIHELSVR